MFSKTFLLSSILALSVFHQIDAYWTVTERSSTKYGNFWAELSEVRFDGNTTTTPCTVDIQPAQDSHSITYDGHTAYVGCSDGPLVSLYGKNRVLKYLRVMHSKKRLNCILVEHTSSFKEYVCGNAVANLPEFSSATVPGNTSSSYSDAKPSPTEERCILGYLGIREGQGPNGACCTHSDDCLDTCVKGVCGVNP